VLHTKHEGVDAAIESARQTREGLGQAISQYVLVTIVIFNDSELNLASRVTNLVVKPVDAEHAESSDRTFSYNAGDGRLVMIIANKMKWTLVNGEWLISYVNFEPIWLSTM